MNQIIDLISALPSHIPPAVIIAGTATAVVVATFLAVRAATKRLAS